MPFKLVYYSQQDPQWKNDRLGLSKDVADTIGYIGCALTSTAMLISGHGYLETPKSLNEKLKAIGGFQEAGIKWGAVSQLYPQVKLKSFIPCQATDAPLGQIDAALAAGQPVIVQVDNSPKEGLQTHWVVLYGKEGDNYLMLDPWPYQPDVTKKTYLMPRYSQGNPLKRAITHVIIYECLTSGSGIANVPTSKGTPDPSATVPAPTNKKGLYVQPTAASGGARLRVKASKDSAEIAMIAVGSQLQVIESGPAGKIGKDGQWIRVRDNKGREGFISAWNVERVPGTSEAAETGPAPGLAGEAGTSSPAKEKTLVVVVKANVGKNGLRVFTSAGSGSIISTEKAGTKLVVVEEAGKAKPKIGKAGKWLEVNATNGKRGFVDAGSVKEV